MNSLRFNSSNKFWPYGFLTRLGLIAGIIFSQTVFAGSEKISPRVLTDAKSAQTVEVLLVLPIRADLSAAKLILQPTQKIAWANQQMQSTTKQAQAALVAELNRLNIEHRSFWAVNVIWAKLPVAQLTKFAARKDIARIEADSVIHNVQPEPAVLLPMEKRGTLAWGVVNVNAPQVWAMGYSGTGVVIAGQDTGYRWDHVALKNTYRGWNGVSADHNYHWHDAIKTSISNNGGSCGLNSPFPCDDHNHGTHTMGSMVGDDGVGNKIGVAPSAKWIGCRNMDMGDGRASTYMACFEWFLAPTDLAGNNPNPALAPHVINNSWGCPPSELCAHNVMRDLVDNVRSAGILVVVSAGNAGSACSTVVDPPAIYASSFSVASHTSANQISGFSSRGPVTIDGSNRLKPDISAPGSNVFSSFRNGGYGAMSGTSMAGPHVAGVAALIMNANPSLKGQPEQIENIIRATATPTLSTENCGGYLGSNIPNAVFGYGRINALAAVRLARGDIFEDSFE